MKVRVWGCRGSIPAPGPATVRYGGNTSCVEISAGGSRVIIDAGTGIRALGIGSESGHATLLLSHYHWDHIQGLPFFGPAYNPETALTVYGPRVEGIGPRDYLCGQMIPPYFPASPSQLVGIRDWHQTPDGEFEIGGVRVRAAHLAHPGVTYGYRLEAGGVAVVYMSDNEPILAPPDLMNGMLDLAAGADLLLHDCQYTEDEYPHHRGWGHSSPRQVADFARHAGVRRLMMFHHDPSHTDEQVEAMLDDVCLLASGIEVVAAAEGMILDVARDVRTPVQKAV